MTNPDSEPVAPIVREFAVTPEFIVELSKAGRFEVTGKTLPRDAKVLLHLTRWDETKKRLVIAVESATFPDVVEEIISPQFKRIA